MGVYLPYDDYSAMQGPAPSGFHVPLTTEWQAVYDIWTALGGGSSDGTNFGIALKLPFAGARDRSNANVFNNGYNGYYWSSSRLNTNAAYNFLFFSSGIYPQRDGYYSYGFSVRPFKNSPVVPTSSWTKLYGTSIEEGGIFWSSADGLISLSSDGNTWITIADKNLGATTVWNSGDALSEANSGKYYQWGNNYGFHFTGSVTTSPTQVDASTYGPGNYYSSSTFITRSSSPYRWDTTDNGNLRGGVTGVKPMSELKNAYIGEYVENWATQGPAPDGFHVPLTTEWQAVYNIWTALGGGSSAGTNFGIALKLPFAGVRSSSSAGVSSQGTYGYYWSSSRIDANYAYGLFSYSSGLNPRNYSNRVSGSSVRCFKNSPVVPKSSWTKLYGPSIEAGGIFWSSTEGLISLSSDGQTWITIQDKNLGATIVWNSGDALSEANCGKYYQRGNNYGFPRTGSVTTSSTLVNASTYGPGNYYSSSTFITRSSSPYRWDTTDNANLWGGEDGNVPVD